MKITKFGHCCLLVEEKGARILIDPGVYSVGCDRIKNTDVIIITHDHLDHLDLTILKKILKNNPLVKVITNKSVGEILTQNSIIFTVLESGEKYLVEEVLIEIFGGRHASFYDSIAPIENIGCLIANKFFYPGDALFDLKRPVDILALPIAGPWLKFSESIDYAIKINPSVCFPVHDGILKSPGLIYKLSPSILESHGIKFCIIDDGNEMLF